MNPTVGDKTELQNDCISYNAIAKSQDALLEGIG